MLEKVPPNIHILWQEHLTRGQEYLLRMARAPGMQILSLASQQLISMAEPQGYPLDRSLGLTEPQRYSAAVCLSLLISVDLPLSLSLQWQAQTFFSQLGRSEL